MRKVLLGMFIGLAAIALSSIYLVSCGGGGGAGDTTSGSLALYATYATNQPGSIDQNNSAGQPNPVNLSGFQQAEATITNVQLLNTGKGTTCDVLTGPVTLDLADLDQVLQLLNVANCSAGPFNRIHVEFDRSIMLISAATPTAIPCNFVSTGNPRQPDTVQCPDNGTACFLDVNGAVNVLAHHSGKVALDFDLKNFVVSNPTSTTGACTVAMNVFPLNASEMEEQQKEEITGLVSNLDTTAMTFTLTMGVRTFTVDYSGVVSTQADINQLLQFAVDNNLPVKVLASSINFDTNTITASAVYVKIKGTVSALDTTDHTFILTFQTAKTVTIDYTDAVAVDGTLVNGAAVEVLLDGYVSASNVGFAFRVDVEGPEMSMED